MLIPADAPFALDAAAAHAIAGWVLVDARLGPQLARMPAMLRVRRRMDPGQALEIALPVSLAGEVHELIRLPEDVIELRWQLPRGEANQAGQLELRRVGFLERYARMARRIGRICSGLPREVRRAAGLTLWRVLADIESAYRVAGGFRGRDPSRYADWIEYFDTLSERDLARIRSDIARFALRPRFRVVVLAGAGSPQAIQATLGSLRTQLHDEFTCAVIDPVRSLDSSFWRGCDASRDGEKIQLVQQYAAAAWLTAFNASLAANGRRDWLMVLRAGDVLPAHALYWFATEALAFPESTVIYSDDDRLDAEGRRSAPRFKPDWSPVHFESINYFGPAAAVRGSAAARAGGLTLECCSNGNYDLILRVLDACGDAVRHIPAVLLHQGEADATPAGLEDPQWCARSLEAHFQRLGVGGRVEVAPTGRRRVRYRLPATPPLASVIVPTRDNGALLRRCTESVLGMTSYPSFELLVVDNASSEPEALGVLAALRRLPRVRVLPYPGAFNYAAINNYAAREAAGELLCLLNNDTEVISADWLEEMTGHLLQKRVGVVGAKLYFPDGKVQHAGVTVGPGGCADHLHVGIARDDPGYCGRAVIAHECSAVTAACLLTWKRLWLKLGGLNERWLPVTFNDVDYCLRVLEGGDRVVFTPHAELYHLESATRGRDLTAPRRLRVYRELKYMQMRWKDRLRNDPYYNLNLSYRRPDFSLSERRRVARPWSNTGL